ncbi:perilipin, isoform CRA_a [Mus musculus]|nr:perilipin, isoform CRA_a [Mus musculus]
MSMNKGPTLLDGDLPEQENVLQRVLQLPVVSGTCECFQKTYNSTKEAHPLVASVCNAYENVLREVTALPNPRGLLGGVVHTVQNTLRNTISAVTWAPAAVLGTVGRILHLTPAQAVSSTKGRAMSLSDALKGVTDNVVDTVVHYVPVSPAPGPPSDSQGRFD